MNSNTRTYYSSDSPGYFYTSEIAAEFDSLYSALKSRHEDLPFHIFVVLRCLQSASSWVTKGSFSLVAEDGKTIEGELCLGVDVVVLEEDFLKIPDIRTNKIQQRLMFGQELMTFLTDKLTRSTKKIPYLKAHKDDILHDIRTWCLENYWLKADDVIDFNTGNWTLPKAELVFGKPFSKKVTDDIDKNLILENPSAGMKYQHLVWNIDGNRQMESWFALNDKKEWRCCWYAVK
jgi:hypothetical protein